MCGSHRSTEPHLYQAQLCGSHLVIVVVRVRAAVCCPGPRGRAREVLAGPRPRPARAQDHVGQAEAEGEAHGEGEHGAPGQVSCQTRQLVELSAYFMNCHLTEP